MEPSRASWSHPKPRAGGGGNYNGFFGKCAVSLINSDRFELEILSQFFKTYRKEKLDVRKRIFNTDIWSVLLYNCEAWPISWNMENKLKSLELYLFRRMQRISLVDSQSKVLVLEMAGAHRSLINVIGKRILFWQ